MKKLLTILALAALTITATFASTENRNIDINGNVKVTNYEFALSYDGNSLTDGSTLTDSYDLSTVSNTQNFIVQRTVGNLNDDLNLDVAIEAGAFIGEFNGDAEYNTGLIPQVNLVSKGYSYSASSVSDDFIAAKLSVVIPAGANLSVADLAAFNLAIKGNSSIPAGDFVSTISVAYTYAQ
jgi:hypothetical protein